MYRDLFIGEWKKIGGNRWMAVLFVWIAPILAVLFIAFALFIATVSSSARSDLMRDGVGTWDANFLLSWLLVNNELGRYIIAAFTAVVFAGEYQHGTWKNFIPYRSRNTLLMTKLVTIAVYVVVAWFTMSLILGFGGGLIALLFNIDYGPFNGTLFRDFIGDYALQMGLTLTATLIAACYAMLAAMFTRNILASFFIAIVVSIAENGILIPLFLLNGLLHINLLWIYGLTPTYNLNNIQSWMVNDEGLPLPQVEETPFTISHSHPLELSIFIIVVLVILLISLTIYRFNRQDITT